MRWMLALAAVALLVVVWLPSDGAPRSRPRGPVESELDGAAERVEAASQVATSGAAPATEEEEEEGPGEEEPCQVTVVSRHDGSPIAGAKVLGAKDICYGVTGAGGVVDIRAGVVSLRASAPGFFTKEFDKPARGCWVTLQPAAPVAGRVLDAATEAPIPDARVSIRASNYHLGAEYARTDAEGRFELQGPLWYPFTLTVRADGYTPATVEGKLAGPVRGLRVALAAGGTLEGHVLDDDGSAVKRAGVGLWAGRKEIPLVRGTTDKDGAYKILGVPVGVEVVPRTSAGHSGDPVVFGSAREVRRRDIRYPAEVELVVTATGPSGEEMEMETARLANERRHMFLRAEPEGRRVSAPPGRYKLEVSACGWPDQVREVVLTSGIARETVVFRAGLAIEGRVVAPDGSPVDGMVDWYDGSTWGSAVVDAQGRFRIDGLSSAPVRLDSRVWSNYTDVSLDGVVPGGPPVSLTVQPEAKATGRLVWKGDVSLAEVGASSVFWNGWCALEDDGRFAVVANDPSEPMSIAFRDGADAYAILSVPPLSPGEVRDVGEVVLAEGRTADGRILDAARTPVVGAAVRVAEHWAEATTRTDGAGRFFLLRMPRSPFWVRVDAEGWPPHFFRIDDAAELRVTAGGVAEGLGRAVIRPSGVYGSYGETTIRADPGPDGRFRARLQPGEYRAWIKVEGRTSKDLVTFTIREGETTLVQLKPR